MIARSASTIHGHLALYSVGRVEALGWQAYLRSSDGKIWRAPLGWWMLQVHDDD